jgi:hypothetical protein
MPLTKRQKRRLLETSRMLESSVTLKSDLSDLQSGYAKELEEVSELIRRGKSKVEELLTKNSSDLSVSSHVSEDQQNTPSDSQETDDGTGEHQTDTNYEPSDQCDTNVPSWVRVLWKKIAMKCHPDRLSFHELSAIDVARRQQWFLDSQKYLDQGDWNRLIHIGIQVNEWVEDMPYLKQYEILDLQYNANSSRINEIQNSLSWNWGTNWDNLEFRIKMIIAYCQAKGIVVPPRAELIEILVNFELE